MDGGQWESRERRQLSPPLTGQRVDALGGQERLGRFGDQRDVARRPSRRSVQTQAVRPTASGGGKALESRIAARRFRLAARRGGDNEEGIRPPHSRGSGTVGTRQHVHQSGQEHH
ncbi:hypothetical protein [Streptomyces sp. NRRL S-146]|uniref:hypothetical protein n=1 Tax=Streptomyces sp. NRRL S-146 TaxID=1463884 RepID=UPI00131DA43A|nr:hypothetical protein [Streptomyces sp. NRRL S-146]